MLSSRVYSTSESKAVSYPRPLLLAMHTMRKPQLKDVKKKYGTRQTERTQALILSAGLNKASGPRGRKLLIRIETFTVSSLSVVDFTDVQNGLSVNAALLLTIALKNSPSKTRSECR